MKNFTKTQKIETIKNLLKENGFKLDTHGNYKNDTVRVQLKTVNIRIEKKINKTWHKIISESFKKVSLKKIEKILKAVSTKPVTTMIDLTVNKKKYQVLEHAKNDFTYDGKKFKSIKAIEKAIKASLKNDTKELAKTVNKIGKTDALKKRIYNLALSSKYTRLELGKKIKKEFTQYKDSTLRTYISDSFNDKYYKKTGIGSMLKYIVSNGKKLVSVK